MSKSFVGSRRWLLVGIVLIVLVAVVAIRGYFHRAEAADKAKAPAPAIPVVTAVSRSESLPIYVTGIGTVQANSSVTVKVRVDGQLEKVAFREGQDVKAGDLLAQIDARPFQASLELARAQKARDQAQLSNALVDLKRYTSLVAEDSLAKQTLDTQTALVETDRAIVKADDATINSAQVQLDYTTIRSPISGRTGLRLVDAGNIVHAADANGVVVVNQIDPIAVVFTLPEGSFQVTNSAIQKGGKQPLEVQAFTREDNTPLGSGQLLLISNQIDPLSGTVQLKGLFTNPGHLLWPGQYVNVHLVLGVQPVITVPSAAIVRGPSNLYLFTVGADGKAKKVTVQVALEQDGKSVISTGLAAGVRVITDGQFRVGDGTAVTENRAGATGATGGASPADATPASASAPKASAP